MQEQCSKRGGKVSPCPSKGGQVFAPHEKAASRLTLFPVCSPFCGVSQLKVHWVSDLTVMTLIFTELLAFILQCLSRSVELQIQCWS